VRSRPAWQKRQLEHPAGGYSDGEVALQPATLERVTA
jgi:hypothetical protein